MKKGKKNDVFLEKSLPRGRGKNKSPPYSINTEGSRCTHSFSFLPRDLALRSQGSEIFQAKPTTTIGPFLSYLCSHNRNLSVRTAYGCSFRFYFQGTFIFLLQSRVLMLHRSSRYLAGTARPVYTPYAVLHHRAKLAPAHIFCPAYPSLIWGLL